MRKDSETQPGGRSPARRTRRRKPAKGNRVLLLSLLLAAIAVLLVAVVAFLPRGSAPPIRLPELTYDQPPSGGSPENAAEPTSSARPNQTPTREPSEPLVPQPTAYHRPVLGGKLIFIIDDVGNDLTELRPFLEFPGPLTLSIMPQRPYSIEAYHLILQAGKVPILHQPMEADGNQNPGPGAIYRSMSRGQVDSILKRNLEGMDEIRWVNNHMGSKATSNLDTMTYVLSYLKNRGIHFLDSRTTKASVVKKVSMRLGLPYYHRNSYFLDNQAKKADIESEIDSGLKVAQKDGYAVMIGHVWDRDLPQLLIRWYPRLVAEGYQFADIRSLPEEMSSNVGARN